MADQTVLPIRRSVRRTALAGLVGLDLAVGAGLVFARPGSPGRWWVLALLLVALAATVDWGLLRLAASRVAVTGRTLTLQYAFYPVVRVERDLVESVQVVESGGLFTPREGLSRSRRQLPVLVLRDGARIPVPMCARIRPEAAEREAADLRAMLLIN